MYNYDMKLNEALIIYFIIILKAISSRQFHENEIITMHEINIYSNIK